MKERHNEKRINAGPVRCAKVQVSAARADEVPWFDATLSERHYLGAGRPVGKYLRQVARIEGERVALLVWGPCCYALKDRDRWIGWSANQRVERLELVVQNRRFLLLTPAGAAPNLASQVLGAALRALPAQWRECFGYEPLLAESFTDREAHAGTCYKASGWQPVGTSEGYSRHRADFYIANERPKRLWLRKLGPGARAALRAAQVPPACRTGVNTAPAGGVLPLAAPHVRSLAETLRRAPDPPAPRPGTAASQRPARLLRSARLRRLLPGAHPHGPGAIRHAAHRLAGRARRRPARRPGPGRQNDPRSHRPAHPRQHEDGAPQAMAVYDQKEHTPRCEQSAALALIERLPALDGKMITADPLHCQRKHARAIVEKGGDYLFQIKGNQPGLLAAARALDALERTPFLSTSSPDAAASKCAAPTPFRRRCAEPRLPLRAHAAGRAQRTHDQEKRPQHHEREPLQPLQR
ncbi:MAG: Druantia anti-phage system protein DruA [Chthoniobacteraceae bacterium]